MISNFANCKFGGLSIALGRCSWALNKISKSAHIPFCSWYKHGDMWGILNFFLQRNIVAKILNNIWQGRKTSVWINDCGQRLWVFTKKNPTTWCLLFKTKSYKFGI
jgi:hypothetical protein